MNIARIDAETSRVTNVEVADAAWIKENADPDGPWIFVPYDDSNRAHIGLAWTEADGFEQPPTHEEGTTDE